MIVHEEGEGLPEAVPKELKGRPPDLQPKSVYNVTTFDLSFIINILL